MSSIAARISSKHLIVIACGVLLLVAVGVIVLHDVSERARRLHCDSQVKRLVASVNSFEGEHGYYPVVLSELLQGTWKGHEKELIQKIENDPWHDVYYYTRTTNGFTIVVVGPDTSLFGLFGRTRRLERHFGGLKESMDELGYR